MCKLMVELLFWSSELFEHEKVEYTHEKPEKGCLQ